MPAHQADTNVARDALTDFRPAIRRTTSDQYTSQLQDRVSGSNFLVITYGMIDAKAELRKIAALEKNWDSYGAEKPSTIALEGAREILSELAASLILASAIVPSAGGGVSIYFFRDTDRTVYIENYNDGTRALVMYDRAGNMEVLEIPGEIAVSALAGTISSYLG